LTVAHFSYFSFETFVLQSLAQLKSTGATPNALWSSGPNLGWTPGMDLGFSLVQVGAEQVS
jgi:hypothetical protein